MNNSEKFWDRMAGSYDREEKKDKKTYTRIIEKTNRFLKSNDIVLDFGCGTGLISNEIAGKVNMIHAIDISSNMIRIAKEKADKRKIENIDYTHSMIVDGTLKKESFDVILTINILHLLDDPQKDMQRINELLKPGGLIITSTPCLGEKRTVVNGLIFFLSKIRILPRLKFFEIAEFEDILIDGNFQLVETEILTHKPTTEIFVVAKKN